MYIQGNLWFHWMNTGGIRRSGYHAVGWCLPPYPLITPYIHPEKYYSLK